MANIEFDFTEFKSFFERLGTASKGDFKKELELFLEGLGFEFLRIIEDEIIRKKVMNSRLLLHSFKKGNEDNIWEVSEGGLTLEVGTNVNYASYANDGHWTNPKGVKSRFVPGYWKENDFIYQPGAKTGMVLKQQWIEGKHYWESAIRILEKISPELLESKLNEWLNIYFKDFL